MVEGNPHEFTVLRSIYLRIEGKIKAKVKPTELSSTTLTIEPIKLEMVTLKILSANGEEVTAEQVLVATAFNTKIDQILKPFDYEIIEKQKKEENTKIY